MYTFALVAEGMTDLAVIERIVEGTLGSSAIVNPLMPIRDATDRARAKEDTFSAWELVLEYAASEQTIVALQTNDFLIFQIDTDEGDHPNFGLKLQHCGAMRSIVEIISECQTLILDQLPSNFPAEWRTRIFFAIPVLSTECWLIPLYDPNHTHNIKTINNCNERLTRINQSVIKKDYRTYSNACKNLSKPKLLSKLAARTQCLNIFVESLKKTITAIKPEV